MTCIAGLVHEGGVTLACDTETTWGIEKDDCRSKIIRKGDMLLAFSGACSVADTLDRRWSPPDMLVDKDKWVTQCVPDSMRDTLKTYRMLHESEGLQEIHGQCVLLIGFSGRLWKMDSRFAMYEAHRGYATAGSGGYVATGALFATSDKTPEERLTLAVKAAQAWSYGCGGDVVLETVA